MSKWSFLKAGLQSLWARPLSSLELLLWDVVHGQVVHVCLDELKGLVLDHPDSLWINKLLEVLHLLPGDAFAIFGGLKCFLEDALDVSHALNTLSHAQAEVTEPLVVECDGPVLAQELNDVGDDALLVSRSQRVEIVFMQANEAP